MTKICTITRQFLHSCNEFSQNGRKIPLFRIRSRETDSQAPINPTFSRTRSSSRLTLSCYEDGDLLLSAMLQECLFSCLSFFMCTFLTLSISKNSFYLLLASFVLNYSSLTFIFGGRVLPTEVTRVYIFPMIYVNFLKIFPSIFILDENIVIELQESTSISFVTSPL